MYREKVLLPILVVASAVCHAQVFRPLEMSERVNHCKYMKVYKCLSQESDNLLLSCLHDGRCCYLDTAGIIHPIAIEGEFVPISFFTGDALIVRHGSSNQYLLYDITQQEVSDLGQPALLSILNEIPQERCNGMVLNRTFTDGIWWNDSALFLVSYKADISRKRGKEAIFHAPKECHITNAFLFSDKYVFINIIDVPMINEYTCVFDLEKGCVTKQNCGFLVNDCRGNYCIAWINGGCAIWQVDEKASLACKIQDITASTGLYGRLGFVSQNTIAWYTREDYDYSTFEPILNQQRLLKIQ